MATIKYYDTGLGQWVVLATGNGTIRSVINTTGNFTIGAAPLTDYVYFVNGNHIGTLPTASGNTNKYTFKNNWTGFITINRAGSDLIDGDAELILGPGESVDLMSNGLTKWNII